MINRRLVLQMLTLSGLALIALVLTMMMPALARADGNITLTKVTTDPVITSGNTVDFVITLTNNSVATLTNVTVIDAECGGDLGAPDSGDTDPDDDILDSTETWVYTCTTASAKTSAFTNTATVTATLGATETTVVSDSNTAYVDVADISLQKTAVTSTILSSSDASFTLTLDNTGSVDLTSISITDTNCISLSKLSGDTFNPGILETDEIWTYTCTQPGATSTFTNVATVTATASGLQVQNSDSASVTVIDGSIVITKTAVTSTILSGAEADFTLTLDNTGSVSLTTINITDDNCGPLSAPSGDDSDGFLETNEIWT